MTREKKTKETVSSAAVNVTDHEAAAATATEEIHTSFASGEASPEFLYVPTTGIEVLNQVRSIINEESDSFKALMQSVKDQGILEPLIVCPDGTSNYRLLCGERRLLAARKIGMETVPVRIVNATQQDQFIALQLTENLQREDLNAIDQAKGILSYFQAKHPERNYDVNGVMSDLVDYKLRPENLADQITPTVGVILEITGKSITTLYNELSLLKLSATIQEAICDEKLPVSQGYLFAANLDCPDSAKIFGAVVKKPVTNAVLTRMLTSWKNNKSDSTKPKTLIQQVKSINTFRTSLTESGKVYKQSDLQKLLDELKAFVVEVELRLQPSP